MQYLEGETLADRLNSGPVPIDEALRYATQIADALDKAHRAGVVHRDVKPGNIMLTKTGAKLLDFGLARSGAPVLASSGFSMLPTTPAAAGLTAQGTILGTFQYMAPEQLEGQEADARTDIFAFGAVLYEMLTGRKAFEGKSQPTLIASIIGSEPPPISTLQPIAPPMLDDIVRTCLAKNPDARWQSVLYTEVKNSLDLWVLPLFGDKKPIPFLNTPFQGGPCALFSGRTLDCLRVE
jgi:serine/threonine protein kinase